MNPVKFLTSIFIIGMVALSPSAWAVDAASNLDEQMDQILGPQSNVLPQTSLLVTLDITSPHAQSGDSFDATVHVINVGSVNALRVRGFLFDAPPGWTVSPTGLTVFDTLLPGEEKTQVYHITRDAEDGSIFFMVTGDNTGRHSSQHVNVPVSPLVLSALAFSMVGLFVLSRERRRNNRFFSTQMMAEDDVAVMPGKERSILPPKPHNKR